MWRLRYIRYTNRPSDNSYDTKYRNHNDHSENSVEDTSLCFFPSRIIALTTYKLEYSVDKVDKRNTKQQTDNGLHNHVIDFWKKFGNSHVFPVN